MTLLKNPRTLALLLSAALVLAAAPLLTPTGNANLANGGKATAHREGKKIKASQIPNARLYSVGADALEPTIAIDKDENIFFAAAGAVTSGTLVMKSTDGGASWEDTSPRVLGQHTHPLTLDPYIWADEPTGRLFTIDLTVACSYMSFSDDQGASWITNPLACGRPVNDHQTLFGGPPALTPSTVYPHILYYCWNDFGAGTSCSKSLDGGLTFVSTGQPVFLGVDVGGQGGFCGGFNGHGVVDAEGTVYLPKEYCGQPILAVSRDEGATWEHIKVADIPTEQGGSDPSVAVDEKGNIYYLFQSVRNRQPYLVYSRDDGETWSKPTMVGHPSVNEVNIPTLDAGKPGAVAFAYVGSTNAPYKRCGLDCTPADYDKVKWNGYVGMSANVFAKNPVFYSAPTNDPKDPIFRGRCDFTTRCGPILDFIDVEISPDGTPYGTFVDACVGPCVGSKSAMIMGAEGITGRLVGGPRLR